MGRGQGEKRSKYRLCPFLRRFRPSGVLQHPLHHVAFDVGQAELASLIAEEQPLMVDAEEVHQGGVMEKLGLGYDVLRGIKPDLIHLSSTGYGDSGPCAKYVTWGPNIEAISGLSQLSGYPHRE